MNTTDDGKCCQVDFGPFTLPTLTVIGIGAGIVLLIFVFCVIGACLCCRKKNNDNDEESGIKKGKGKKAKENEYIGLNDSVPLAVSATPKKDDKKKVKKDKIGFKISDVLDKDLEEKVNACMLDSNKLTLNEVIGQGNFGLVYKGTLKDEKKKIPMDVAVKTVHGDECTKEELKSFLNEALRMIDFQHSNILCMQGIVIMESKPFVVLPYMTNGDLKNHLQNPEKKLLLKNLLEYSKNIADGMDYLAEKGFIHRDLAARNCMVGADEVVKVADFGLSRDLHDSDYYKVSDLNIPLPVKWMAIESITAQKFSTKSDVWSFGVLMIEILTRGETPYPGMSNVQVIKFIRNGKHMECPGHVAPEIFSIIEKCWERDPVRRPHFHMISKQLGELLEGKTKKTKNAYMNFK